MVAGCACKDAFCQLCSTELSGVHTPTVAVVAGLTLCGCKRETPSSWFFPAGHARLPGDEREHVVCPQSSTGPKVHASVATGAVMLPGSERQHASCLQAS